MTSPPPCSATTTRGTARCSATARSSPTRSRPPGSPSSTAPSTPSNSSKRHDVTADERFAEPFRSAAAEPLLGTRSEIITGPVDDWATDFSHLEPEWAADPYPIQDDLRERCPV